MRADWRRHRLEKVSIALAAARSAFILRWRSVVSRRIFQEALMPEGMPGAGFEVPFQFFSHIFIANGNIGDEFPRAKPLG